MYQYSVSEWLFFFYIYCFLGWVIESCFVSVKKKKWVNRGFMAGPFLPLYGSGAIMMLIVSRPFQNNLIATYFAGVVGATLLEYVTGVTMEALFKVRYWDYSNQKFNFQGQICLTSSLAWGFYTILMTRVIHKPIEAAVLSLSPVLVMVIVIVISVVAAADFAVSFKTAIDLRIILDKMEKAKQEMARMQHRLDVVIALASEENEQRKENLEQKIEEKISQLKENAEYSRNVSAEKLDSIQKGIEERIAKLKKLQPGLPDSVKQRIGFMEKEYSEQKEQKEKRSILRGMKLFTNRRMLRGNPGMVSRKFKGSMEEFKTMVFRKHDGSDKEKDQEHLN